MIGETEGKADVIARLRLDVRKRGTEAEDVIATFQPDGGAVDLELHAERTVSGRAGAIFQRVIVVQVRAGAGTVRDLLGLEVGRCGGGRAGDGGEREVVPRVGDRARGAEEEREAAWAWSHLSEGGEFGQVKVDRSWPEVAEVVPKPVTRSVLSSSQHVWFFTAPHSFAESSDHFTCSKSADFHEPSSAPALSKNCRERSSLA